ncbi:hypothetical protein [Prevotella sp. kh1p2]|uniref:hypothetical protein n=1 Tax=Prevotella sp. kh1p2 TaxID=1761883 RepID=UPI000B84A110|nr:hypothetical protein [Prevotella sp. kh1p2]
MREDKEEYKQVSSPWKGEAEEGMTRRQLMAKKEDKSSPPNLPFLRGGYRFALLLGGNCLLLLIIKPAGSFKTTLLFCLKTTAAAE